MFNAYTPPQNSEVNLDNVTISSQEYLIALNSIVMAHRILNFRGITLNIEWQESFMLLFIFYLYLKLQEVPQLLFRLSQSLQVPGHYTQTVTNGPTHNTCAAGIIQ